MTQQHTAARLRFISNVFACCLIVAGLFFLYVPTQTVSSENFLLSDGSSNEASNSVSLENTAIQKLNIPMLDLELAVKAGSYNRDSQTWTIDQTHVFAADNSKTPLIYGHDTPEVFGNLSRLKPGDVLIATNSDNRKVAYKLTEKGIVRPEDASVLDYYKPGTIHLLTCTGNRSELREILRFELI